MAILKNKILYVLNEKKEYVPLYTVDNEVFLTADPVENLFLWEDFKRAVRYPLSKRVVRVYYLNEDESINQDISEHIIGGDISFTYAQGITRTANITIDNYSKEMYPSPINGVIWQGRKFRIDLGLCYSKTIYWKKCGIFVTQTPSIDETSYTTSIQLYDKFAMLDGTIGGKRDHEFKIPVGTKVHTAIQMCLNEDKGNGNPYDYKALNFPAKYENEVTPYTITKSNNCSMGEIILELAKMLSCDVFYDDDGHLSLTSDSDTLDNEMRGIWWDYNETELLYSSPSISYNSSNAYNKITVCGAIKNGYQFKGTYENTNPKSQYNTNISEIRAQRIDDDNIMSDELCYERAKYEYMKNSRNVMDLKCTSIFIPCLLPNNIVTWSNRRLGIVNEKFILNSIDIDLMDSGFMNIGLTSLNEVVVC